MTTGGGGAVVGGAVAGGAVAGGAVAGGAGGEGLTPGAVGSAVAVAVGVDLDDRAVLRVCVVDLDVGGSVALGGPVELDGLAEPVPLVEAGGPGMVVEVVVEGEDGGSAGAETCPSSAGNITRNPKAIATPTKKTSTASPLSS